MGYHEILYINTAHYGSGKMPLSIFTMAAACMNALPLGDDCRFTYHRLHVHLGAHRLLLISND